MPVLPILSNSARPSSSPGDREPSKPYADTGDEGQQERYVLNVRGQRYEIEKSLCSPPAAPDALLACLDAQHGAYCERRGEYFFNRDPVIFNCILSFYVTGKLHFPTNICPSAVRQELQFWGLSHTLMADCCWERMYDDAQVSRTLERLAQFQALQYGERRATVAAETEQQQQHSLPDKVFWTLENPLYSRAALIYSYVSLFVLGLSIVCLILSTHMDLRNVAEAEIERRLGNATTIPYGTLYRFSGPVLWVIWLDRCTMLYFFAELLVKVVCCCCCCHGGPAGRCGPRGRWRRLLTFYTLLDVIIVTPTLIFIVLGNIYTLEQFYLDTNLDLTKVSLESLRFVRVFRLLRLLQHNRPMQIIYVALRASYKELLILIALISFMATIWGSVIFYAELATDTFHGIGYGMWWALVTMTTVGYGDYFPKAGGGYFVGTLCAVSGILILALPIPVIANNFNTYYRHYQFLERVTSRAQKAEKMKEMPATVKNHKEEEDGTDSDTEDAVTISDL